MNDEPDKRAAQPRSEAEYGELFDSPSTFVAQLAEEFIERYRKGEQATIREYCDRYPLLADEIRTVFPTIAIMERIAILDDDKPSRESIKAFTPMQLGDYQLVREIGRGGMGIVYEAIQISLHRQVAVKVLPPQFHSDSKHKRRFEREAQAAAKLHHTHIVPVFGVGEHNGVSYYVMQLIQGLSFDVVLKQIWRIKFEQASTVNDANATVFDSTPWSPSKVAPLTQSFLTGSFEEIDLESSVDQGSSDSNSSASQLLGSSSGTGRIFRKEQTYYQRVAHLGVQINDALAYAHQQGIVHRDIKPSNLILDQRGKVWVTDFGLAKLKDQEDLTLTGDLLGTIRYMPPEALEGRADARSDVYSLGITLYEMLALRPAFEERDRGKLLKLLSGDGPTHLMKVVPDIPRDLATIIHKAIDREWSNRYSSPSEFAADLRLFLEDRPIRARQANALEQLARWGRRNPAVASLISVAACLLVALLAISAVDNFQLSHALKVSQDNLDRALRAERESRLREADALVGKAQGFRLSRQEGQRIAALAAIDRAANIGRELKHPEDWFAKLRNEAIAALALPDLHIVECWEGFPKGTNELTISDDFRRYARLSDQGIISVRSVEGDREIGMVQVDPTSHSLKLNRDGSFVSCWCAEQPSPKLRFWMVTETGLVHVVQTEIERTDRKVSLQFLDQPDSHLGIVAKPNGVITLFDLEKGIELRSLEPRVVTKFPETRVHPHRPLMAVYSYFINSVVIRNYETGETVLVENPPWDGGSSAAWHPSGELLCITKSDSGDCRVYAFDETSRTLTYQRSIPIEHGHAQLAFNQAGDRVFATGWYSAISMANFWTGQVLFTSKSGTYGLAVGEQKVGFGGTGKHAFEVGPFSTAEGKELLVIKPRSKLEKNTCYDFAIHPNGRIIVIHFTDGIHFFEMQTGQELAFLEDPKGDGTRKTLQFDRSGSLYLNSMAGCFRIPIKSSIDDPDQWVAGPPEKLPFHLGWEQVSASADGTVVAQPMYAGYGMSEFAGGWIAYKDQPLRWVAQGESNSQCSVSLDGHWVAFQSRVYEANTGKVVFDRPGELLRFCSNGRWLLGAGRFSSVYENGTWKKIADLGEGIVVDCTPDESMAVVFMPSGDGIRLVEVPTGRELAVLSSPDKLLGACEMTLDGNWIAYQSQHQACVWDLRRLKEKLKKLGLEWKLTKGDRIADSQGSTSLSHVPLNHNKLRLECIDLNLLNDPIQHAKYERRQLWRQLLAQPWKASHYVAWGRHSMQQGWFETAFWFYSAAILLGADASTYEDRAEADYRTDRWSSLVEDVDRCLSQSDTPRLWRLRRALARRCLGQYEQAIEDLDECIKSSPQSVLFHYYRGDTWEQLGRSSEASADFATAARLQSAAPSDANDLIWKLVTGPRSMWLPNHAYSLALKSIATRESQSLFLNTLGVACYRVGEFEEALGFLERNLESGKGDAFDFYFIAMCHARLGHATLAKKFFLDAENWFHENRRTLNEIWLIELYEFRNEAKLWIDVRQP